MALATFVLTGCPGTWGFRGQIHTVKDPDVTVHVLSISSGNTLSSDAFVPVAGATVTCDGCEKPILVDANGKFGVSLGVSYREPTPVVLHVRAPGYDPVDVQVAHPGGQSEAGFPSMTIVMKKQSSTPVTALARPLSGQGHGASVGW